MRRPLAILVLALCLVGCGPRDEQAPLTVTAVPLLTVEDVAMADYCVLEYRVVDVIADPASGTPVVKDGGEPLRWPRGYSARRAGPEVEVLDARGHVVLTTGGRYWMCPLRDFPDWVIGSVKPCPRVAWDTGSGWDDCRLGHGVL